MQGMDPLQHMVTLQWGRNFAVAETKYFLTYSSWYRKLQWGRNFAVAETLTGPSDLIEVSRASMGPQLCSCGNPTRSAASRAASKAASMGPQLCSCGNWRRGGVYSRTCRGFNGAATLQLRKRSSSTASSSGDVGLQWGRNFAVAETLYAGGIV